MKYNLTSFLFIFTFIFNTRLISSDNGASDMVITSEWNKMLAENRPPTDDNYLYVTGPKARMNIVYSNPQKINCETNGIELSFRYWASWNQTKFPVVKEGTELFRLAVMPCHRSMPATKFILFDDFDPSNWNYATYTAARNNDFNFKCDKKVDIEVSDNEDYLNKIRPTDEYLVAIKDLHMRYSCVMQNAEALLANETCSIDESAIIRCIDATCTKDDCPSTFSVQGGSWSPDNLPDRDERYEDFWYTHENLQTTTIVLAEKDNSMTCIDIGYWITGESSIQVDIGAVTITLDATIEFASGQYKWMEITLCPRWFAQEKQEDVSKIIFTSDNPIKKDLVAISIDHLSLRPLQQNRKINNFLYHFSRPEAKDEWIVIPSYMNTTSDNSSDFEIELTFPDKTDGYAYIFSKWFKYSPEIRFRGVLTADQLYGMFSVQLTLHEENGKVVFTKNMFYIDADSPDEMKTYQHLNIKLDSFETNALKKSTLCFVMIKVTFKAVQESKLTLREVDVGDGCRESEINCMGHGTCINLEPDQYQCSCNRGWIGSHCESINYCETVDSVTGLTGEQFCVESEGICNPMMYSPSSYVCECEQMKYWNLIKHSSPKSGQVKGHCELVSKCVGMVDLCPTGYACDEDVWSVEQPCQVCDRENGYTMYDGACIKVDACYNKCGTAKCYPIGLKYYCYCEGNEILSDDEQSCITPDECTPWGAQKLKCDHNCVLSNSGAECSCYDGYKLGSSDGNCERQFNCTISCPEKAVCVLDKNNSPTCECQFGWDWDEESGKCVDICRLADRGIQKWSDYVQRICGDARCGLVDDKFRCICKQPTFTNIDGLCELEKICFPGNRGFIECSGRNALCEPRSNGHSYTYLCICPPGKYFELGFCVDQCDQKRSECESMNAICRIVEEEETGGQKPTCSCRPGFVMISGYCYLAEHSIKATFLVKISDDKLRRYETSLDDLMESFCADIDHQFVRECHLYTRGVILHWLQVEIDSSMDRIIARYVDSTLGPDVKQFADQIIDSVTLISYEKSEISRKLFYAPTVTTQTSHPSTQNPLVDFDVRTTGDYKITVSLQMKTRPLGHASLLRLFCYDLFSPNDPRYDYCLIPSKTLVRKGTFEESDLNPCSESTIDYCPKDTSCLPDFDETKYRCFCNPGFVEQTSMKLDRNNSDLVKHYCIDVNECEDSETLCQAHSTCVNTVGSYKCVCNDFFVSDSGKCIELCEFQNCQHGECVITSNKSAICRCDSWHAGDRCEMINKVALFWRTTTIVVAGILSSIIVIFIITSIVVARRSKSSAVENGYLKNRIELTDSMYMQHIRPTMRNLRHQPISTNFEIQT